MADKFKVLDLRVDELAANLNALSDDPWGIFSQDYYLCRALSHGVGNSL